MILPFLESALQLARQFDAAVLPARQQGDGPLQELGGRTLARGRFHQLRSGVVGRLGPQRDAFRRANLVLDLERHRRVGAQILPRIVLALTDAVAAIAVPRARLLDDIELRAEIEDLALAGDAFAIKDVELASLNGGATLFFTTLTLVRLPIDLVALLDRPMRRMSSRTEA